MASNQKHVKKFKNKHVKDIKTFLKKKNTKGKERPETHIKIVKKEKKIVSIIVNEIKSKSKLSI